MDILFLWSVLRILISLAAAAVSSLRPINAIEKSIAVWPPISPLPTWLERVSISPLFRWDAHIYTAIAMRGPAFDDGTAAFHPLYPLLSRPFMALGFSSQLSLIIVSNLAGIGLLYFFYQLARMDLAETDARTSVLLLLFSPLTFLLFVPYSEALFLLFSVISLLTCRRRNWLLAGLAGGLATLTRQQGIFLVLPLAWELWDESQGNLRMFFAKWKSWTGILIIPLCYAGWILYRGLALNDVSLDFTNPIDAIYSILLSPTTTQVVPQIRFLFPWQAILLAIEKIRLEPDIDIWTNLVLGVVFVLAAIVAWPKLRNSYRLFVLANVLVALSFYTGSVHPYMGMPRHMWLAFPIYIGLAPVANYPWKRLTYVVIGLISMIFLLFQYVLESWVL